MSEQNEQKSGAEDDTRLSYTVAKAGGDVDAVYVGEAIFTAFSKKSVKGEDKIFTSFLLHPQDSYEGLAQAELGTIFKLYITKPDLGA